MATDISSKYDALVYVCPILKRSNNLGVLTSSDHFTSFSTEYNEIARSLCEDVEDVFFHSHKGFWNIIQVDTSVDMQVDFWSLDGIHPSGGEGRHRYKNSLQNVLYKGIKMLNYKTESYWTDFDGISFTNR